MENSLSQNTCTKRERTRGTVADLVLGALVKVGVTPEVRGCGRQPLTLVTRDMGSCEFRRHPGALEGLVTVTENGTE